MRKKNNLTLAKTVKKTLFRAIEIGVKTHSRGERTGSTPNTAKTAGDLEPTGRMRGSVNVKLLGGSTKHWGILAKGT